MTTENLGSGVKAQDSLTQTSLLSLQIVIALLCVVVSGYFLLRRNPRLKYHLSRIGGPPTLPVLGNALLFLRPHDGIFAHTT